MAGIARLRLGVTYDDGTGVDVVADQRDFVIFEAETGKSFLAAISDASVTTMRHCAWLALRRHGLIDGGLARADWEATVPYVRIDLSAGFDTGTAPLEIADPGIPEAAATKPSDSRSGRARASGRSSNSGRPRT